MTGIYTAEQIFSNPQTEIRDRSIRINLICTTGIFKDSEFKPILFKNISKEFFKYGEARLLKLLPWSRMHFKMTIFWTIVIITHVTVNWIVLCFPATSSADRRHIHCVYIVQYVFAWLKVLQSHPEASNSSIIVLLYYFFQCLGTSLFPYLLFLSPSGMRTL